MADTPAFIVDPVAGDAAVSPLAGHREPGEYPARPDGACGVTLCERFGLSICEATAWRGQGSKLRAAIRTVSGLQLKVAPGSGVAKEDMCAFDIGPDKYLVSGTRAGFVAHLIERLKDNGTVTDLSHGRTVIRIDGPKSRWVLAKLFAIDFADEALPLGQGVATAHHDILAQIQRVGPDAFDVYVFRSFARSFWHLLCRSSAEVGFRVM